MDQLFAQIRTLTPSLTQAQVDSVNAIIDNCRAQFVTDNRQIAYILATAFHEARFKPIEEKGKGAGLPYGKKLDIGGGPNKRVPYTTPDKLFYGRGLVQLTWLSNYKAFSRLLGVDLVNQPELALQTNYAAKILVAGMKKGMFTSHTLAMFFNDHLTDPIEARTIINGHDRALLIKNYYDVIYKGLTL